MGDEYRQRIEKLKQALLEYLGRNGRYYGQLTRLEQSVEDLAQALNTRLDQLLLAVDNKYTQPPAQETPVQRLAGLFLVAGTQLSRVKMGGVDAETVDQFAESLDLLDMASDFRRKAASAQDKAESLAVKSKRDKGS